MIFVLFGPPGVGKTYMGKLFSERLGMDFLDADTLYEPDEIRLLQEGVYDQEDRDTFFLRLQNTLATMVESNGRDIILAAAFTKEKNRQDFFNRFDKSICYIRVFTPKDVAVRRARERLKNSTHTINEIALEMIWSEFDEPRFMHMQLVNDGLSDDQLVHEFTRLIQLIEK